MGILKRAMLARDDAFGRFLQELLDEGCIEGAAAGIAKKVIADGGNTNNFPKDSVRCQNLCTR